MPTAVLSRAVRSETPKLRMVEVYRDGVTVSGSYEVSQGEITVYSAYGICVARAGDNNTALAESLLLQIATG